MRAILECPFFDSGHGIAMEFFSLTDTVYWPVFRVLVHYLVVVAIVDAREMTTLCDLTQKC